MIGIPVGFVRLSLAFFAAGLLTLAAPARAQTFASAAEVALVQDYDSGAVLYEKNADQPTPPASTAKLLTAEIVFRELKEGRLHLDDNFDVSEKAWREGGAHAHGAAMFLALNSHVSVDDLLRGLLIQSGNDAAMTLAEGIGGTEENFADIMNKRAAELGMAHSHFTDARGKADPNQYVTARDMALLATHVIRDDQEYYHYFSEKDFTWDKIHQLNRNPILTMNIGADGLKAADPRDGGFGLVGTAVQDGQRLIVVMYGLKSATERLGEARKLFDYGFHSFDHQTVFEAGQTVGTASVYGGASGEVPLVSDRPIMLFVPRGESGKLVAKIVYNGPLAAPLEKGQDAGRLKIWRDDMLVVDAPLKTGAPVALGSLTSRALDAGIELAGDAAREALQRAFAHK
jgi:serine-type D-Ala-D-Ala carboxypeptidase (penicillin-binding protein 5/6)